MLTNINLGTRVKIKQGNRWESYGDNPSSAVGGVIASTEGGWVIVEWDGIVGQFNYRPFDLAPEA